MARWHCFDFQDLPLQAFRPRPGGGMTLEGGKGGGGSSAPPPDPRLVAAQIKSLGVQDDVIQRMLANSESLLPYQREQMQFAIDTGKQSWEQAQADREWTLERRGQLTGLQNRLIEDARSYDEGDRRAGLQAQAFADVNAAFTNAQGQQQRALGRAGVAPGTGKALALGNSTALAQASALANASQKVSEAARQEGYALTDRATNALAGYPAMGMQATGAGAGYGQLGLGAANQGLAGMNSGFGAAGGLAGQMGTNATNMWNAQASYKNNQDHIANQNRGDTFGGILGGLGGLATGLNGFSWSDRRLKENIVAVGRDERTGLTLYEFNYKDNPQFRWRGVMADEVREHFPEAVYRNEEGYDRVYYAQLGLEMKLVDAPMFKTEVL